MKTLAGHSGNISHLHATEVAKYAMPPTPDPVKILMDCVRECAESAVKKTAVADLTEGEKFAIAYYAGVPIAAPVFRESWSRDPEPPYKFVLQTVPCGLYHDGEKWRVVMRTEDEPRRRR